MHRVPGFPSPAVVSRSPAAAAKSQPLNSSVAGFVVSFVVVVVGFGVIFFERGGGLVCS